MDSFSTLNGFLKKMNKNPFKNKAKIISPKPPKIQNHTIKIQALQNFLNYKKK